MNAIKAYFKPKDPQKLEVLCRITIAATLSFILSVADVPSIVPPSLSFAVGLVGGVAGFAFPYLIFALGAVFPSLIVNITVALLGQSALLAAASVSDGLMVAMFALYTSWCTCLYFGPNFDKTSSAMGLLCSMAGLLTLSYKPLVQEADDGLAVVRALWTEKGLENPLAANRNFLIVFLWGMACVAVAILIPPFRTARAALTRTVIPGAIMNTAASIQGDSGSEEAYKNAGHLLNVLSPSAAGLILFEPRLVKAPLENAVPKLQALLKSTALAILASLLISSSKRESWSETETDLADQAKTSLSKAAKALATCDTEEKGSSKKLEGGQSDDDVSPSKSYAYTGYQCVRIFSDRLLDSALAWNHAMNHPDSPSPCSKEGISNLSKAVLPWVLAPFGPLIRLLTFPLVLFRPKEWNLWPVLWSMKYTAGLVALFSMSVYWEGYSNFALKENPDDQVGAVFNGWNLMSYTIAWTATVEGTVKMALMRILGTCIGGFWGWIGVMLCSLSYNPAPEDINEYGLVVFLTVSTVFLAYFSLGSGFTSYLGPSGSSAKVETWTVLTFGKGPVNDLVANRVVATVSGVVMAAIVAAIPPYTLGSDPKHAREYLDRVKDAFNFLLTDLSSDEENDKLIDKDAFVESFKDIPTKRRIAVYLLKDASKAEWFPFYKVDGRLMPLIEEITMTEALVAQLLEVDIAMPASEKDHAQKHALRILSSLGTSELEPSSPSENDRKISSQSAGHLVITLCDNIFSRINQHEAVFSELA